LAEDVSATIDTEGETVVEASTDEHVGSLCAGWVTPANCQMLVAGRQDAM